MFNCFSALYTVLPPIFQGTIFFLKESKGTRLVKATCFTNQKSAASMHGICTTYGLKNDFVQPNFQQCTTSCELLHTTYSALDLGALCTYTKLPCFHVQALGARICGFDDRQTRAKYSLCRLLHRGGRQVTALAEQHRRVVLLRGARGGRRGAQGA
jgi:hypothetical protein